MEANPTTARSWDDLVFEHRNKLYGAYPLRRGYPDRVIIGLSATIIVVLIMISLQDSAPRITIPKHIKAVVDDGLIILTPPPLLPQRPKSPPLVDKPEKNVRKNTTPLVTRDEVMEDEEVQAITDYVADGEEGLGDVGTIEGIGTIALPDPEPPADGPIDIAQVMPSYEGGMEAMMKFIQKRLRYPHVPRELRIEGTVYVRFVVRGDGSVTDVQVIRGIHRDCDEEAARVIALLPAWKGGRNNGRPVSVRMVLPIRFRLE